MQPKVSSYSFKGVYIIEEVKIVWLGLDPLPKLDATPTTVSIAAIPDSGFPFKVDVKMYEVRALRDIAPVEVTEYNPLFDLKGTR